MIRAGVFGNKIIIETDDPSVKGLLEYMYIEKKYNFFFKQMRDTKVKGKIYDRTKKDPKTGNQYYEIGIGFVGYIVNIFKDYLIIDDYKELTGAVLQDSYRMYPFPELRDYQNDDVLHLLKYKFGLFSCYTSYGKTQTISVLAKYFYQDLRKKVLLITPGIKARDELIKRIRSLYGIDVSKKFGHGRIQSIITTGFMNKKDLKDPSKELEIRKELGSFDVVLSDEVEYCINPAGIYMLENCVNAQYRYGFSGTADKSNAEMITFIDGITRNVAENRDLVKYFGPSLIYRLPLDMNIDLISIKTDSLNRLKFADQELNNSGNIYNTVMTKIWSQPEVCKTIVKVAKAYPMLFIPINNLQNVINNWIENYFIGELRVLLISGEGYIYYDLDGNRIKLSLQEACECIKNGEVDIIPSTSSGYRALDFPGLENIFLIQGAIAGVVLQCIGRVARGKHMNIISLDPLHKTKIPIYSNGRNDRRKMIQEYYKYCKLTESEIQEKYL